MVLPSMRDMEAAEQKSLIALDVLYPDVCKLCDLKIISHQASIICMKSMNCLISLKRAREIITLKTLCPDCYLCLCNELIHGLADYFMLSKG